MAIRLDEARLRMLKIVDTSNTIKIYPNNITSYTGLVVEGFQNGGYDGIHLGPNSNYMTVMSNDIHQGLYNQSSGRWIVYFNRSSNSIGLGTNSLVSNNTVTIDGNAIIKNLLTVANGVSHYGIKVGNTYINAIDGDIIFQNNNALRFGSDNWNWDEWAGLRYDWTNKRIYLGIADKNIFNGNNVMSGGRILTPGISHFHVGNQTTYYMTSSGDIKASSVTVDNNNSSGSIQLVEDGEGGTIRLYSKSNTYCYEIDAYNDETIRIHTANKNPNGTAKFICWNGKTGNLSADGTFYVQNAYPVMPLVSANGYYGMGLPDASTTNWIRTTVNGIIPYASGGSSALGTSTWPFNSIWSKGVDIINTYYPAFRLTAQTANSQGTYSKGMFEVNYSDSIGMWIHSDSTTDAKSRRALVLYGYGQKTDASQAVALRQCNTSGTWLSDLYLLHTGNYNSYALPLAGGTMSSGAAIKFTATAGSIATSDPMSITYGRIAAYGTLCINANTDNSGTEYVILTAGKGHSSSTVDGLAVGTSTLTWLGNSVLTTAGGTLNNNAVLRRRYVGVSWVQGRAGAVLANSYDANNRYTSNAYNPLWSVKSMNGSWDCGTYTADNNLYFTYITDANFDANNNTTTHQILISGTTGRIHANLEGTAKYLGRSGDPAVPMAFYWSGQSGQPSWLWGGNDGTNMYVYNPSNFSVNYANSAGSVAWSNITGKPGSFTPSDHTHNYLPIKGTNTIAAGSGDTTAAWGALGNNTTWWYSDSGTLTDKPSSWGFVWQLSNGTDVNQLWFSQSGGVIKRRSGNASGWNGTWRQIWQSGDSITGAVWNDYAEYRESSCEEPGRVLFENGNDTLSMTTKRLQHFAGVSSDTWGFCQGETEKAKTPIAVAGRVLVYTYQDRNNYKPGDCVCAAPGGTVDIMTREEIIQYPDRIVGTVSCVPEYLTWGSGDRDPVDVNGRIWIKV